MSSMRRPALGVLLLLVGLAAGSVAAQPAARAPTRIKLVAPPFLTSAPFFVAADLGFFAAQGLDVEFVEIRGASASLPALAQGQVDAVGAVIGPAVLNLVARGAPIRIVAARGYQARDGCAANAMLARKSLIAQGRLSSPAALRGLRLSVDRTGAASFFVGTLLDSAGLTLDEVEVSDIAEAARGEALARDLIDVVMSFEPWVTKILDTGAAEIWIPASEIAPDFQYAFLLFGSRLLVDDRDAGRRFVRAYLEGVERYLDEAKSPRLIEILARRTHLDADLLRRACWPPTVRDGAVDRAGIERYQAWAVKEGLIDTRLDVAKLIDAGLLASPSAANRP